jgi:pentatricopeptide repeat protein
MIDADIALCGPLRVGIADRCVESLIPGPKGRLLLARLVLGRDEPLGRDELIETVWPDTPPTFPDRAFSTLLTRLRAALGPGVLQGRSELTLALGTGTRVDWDAAEAALEAAEAASGSDPVAALEAAEEGLATTRRTFLPGLSTPWVEERRRELTAMHASLLEVAAAAALRLGQAKLGERRARELIASEPYRESAYAMLMRAHAASGNVAEAMRVYDDLRRLLRDELGLIPSRSVTSLAEALLNGEGATPVMAGAAAGALSEPAQPA